MRLALGKPRIRAGLPLSVTRLGFILFGLVLAGCALGVRDQEVSGPSGIAESNLQPLTFLPVQPSEAGFEGFQAFTGSGALFFSPAEIFLALADRQTAEHDNEKNRSTTLTPVRLEFLGADLAGELTGTNPVRGVTNLLLGSDPQRWQVGVLAYSQLKYGELYPGVDLTIDGLGALAGGELQLKSTFHLAAGVDPAQIRWRYDGATRVDLADNGDLVVEAVPGPGLPARIVLYERAPVAWQIVKGRRVSVATSYQLAGAKTIQFEVGDFDPAYPLVIDPTLDFGTFIGGAGYDEALGVAVDGARSVILVGSTVSADYPSETPIPEEYLGTKNVFITKVSRDGSQLDFSTILGGTGEDEARGLAVDNAGDIYLTGVTFSPDFPVVLPGQVPEEDSSGNVFIVKLSLSGGTIRYSTAYGGTGSDDVYDIAVDTGGSVVVGGETTSQDFPLAAPIQASSGGGEADGFILRLNASGNQLLYSSYLGGSAFDSVQAIDIDRRGSIYVTGTTDSIDFPTESPMQGELGGLQDTFLAKLNPEMAGYEYSTYEGFGISSVGNDIVVDGDGYAYVVGTMGRTESEGRGGSDAYVFRLKADGTGLDINIVLGGNGDDEGLGLGLDRDKNVYITGYTESSDLDSAGTFQPGYGGDGDAFLAQLNPVGELVTYNYLGGSNLDRGNAIEVVSSGDAVIAGVTFSVDFPILNALQSVNRGDGEVFILKIQDIEFVPTPAPTSTPEATPLPPTATPVPTALESIVESDTFVYGLFGLMGFIFLLLVIEVVRGGRRRR